MSQQDIKAATLPREESRKKQRVMLVGPVFRGKQAGGIEMFNEIVLDSDLLKEQFDILHLDTTRTAAGEGKASTLALINFYYFFQQFALLLYYLIFSRPRIMHQPITDRISFWKEGVFMFVARLMGVRVIGHVHGCMFREVITGKNWLVKRLAIAVLRQPHVLIALSDGWRNFLLENVHSGLEVVVVPNTVDTDFARLAHAGCSTPSKPDPVMVLYVGSLHIRKGILVALQAIARVRERCPDTIFVFAGGIKQASEREEIERAQEAALAQGNVVFPGIVTGREKLQLFKDAHMLILPSYFENLPIVVLEAMAAGLPLIVTAVGALPEILREGEHGYFVESGDAEGLADRIVQLATHRELREAMGRSNQDLFRCAYDQPTVLGKIEHIYTELLNT